MGSSTVEDERQIRALIEDWVVCRDSGLWERFASLWHPHGQMSTTWFHGTASAFAAASRRGFEQGVDVVHSLGGTAVEVRGSRAVAQTRMTISQRAELDGISVDVTCLGRFYDFLLSSGGGPAEGAPGWLLVRRQPIYERDRMDPVQSGSAVTLDPALMARFPVGYQHLAYLHSTQGLDVRTDLPVRRGQQIDGLYAQGDQWLGGADISEILARPYRGRSLDQPAS